MSEENNVSDGSQTNNSAPNAASTQQGPSEVDELKGQVEKFKNEYLYLKAEFENYKRNVIKERSDLLKYGSERLLVEVLGVVDNFERALETKINSENFANFSKGVEMTYQDLKSALVRFGVTELSTLGQPFDPNIHEALSSEETDQFKAGHISRVFKKPYKLHDKVIRPGQVVVAKEPSKNQ